MLLQSDGHERPENENGSPPRYRVAVDDHFHYQDASERWEAGTFASLVEAIAYCDNLLERTLADMHQPGMSADQLLQLYGTFGEDPFIMPIAPDETPVTYSAWDAAQAISRRLTNR